MMVWFLQPKRALQKPLSILLLALLVASAHYALFPDRACARLHVGSASSNRHMPELKGLSLSPDGTSIQLDASNLQNNGGRAITVLRFSSPSRLLVDIPNVRLSEKAVTTLPVHRYGVDHVELTEINSDFYNAVRAIIYVQDDQTLSRLSPVLDGNLLRFVPLGSNVAPMTAMTTKTHPMMTPPQKESRRNRQREAYAQPLAPVTTPLPTMTTASGPVPLRVKPFPGEGDAMPLPNQSSSTSASANGPLSIFGTPLASDLSVIDSISLRDEQIVVQSRNGSPLRIKNRSILTAPSRLVIDLDNSILASRSLLGPVRGETSDRLRSVRVGQFDERTVRLVIESSSPDLFESVFNGQKHDNLSILPVTPATPNRSTPTAASANSRPGEIESIDLKREHGGTLLRLETSTPIQHRLLRRDNKLTLDLLNETGNPTVIGFDGRQFPEIDKMRLDSPAPANSRLSINLANAAVRIVPTLSGDGKVLELLLVNDGTTGLSEMPTSVISGTGNLNKLEEQQAVMQPAGDAPFAARIVVDAGHGGKDIGANRSGVNEKDLNLALALMVRDALTAKGFKVFMTRSTDVFLPLPQITAITNQIHPDLFISIHHNASVNAATHGIETYFYTPQSIPLAKKVHTREIAAVRERDGGVKQARFYVIHHTDVPAILCEVGYVSNPDELNSLQGMERKSRTAQSIADGVVDYLQTRVSASARPRSFGGRR
jgi:N-acetylmuramoyl-L-alanine amidase